MTIIKNINHQFHNQYSVQRNGGNTIGNSAKIAQDASKIGIAEAWGSAVQIEFTRSTTSMMLDGKQPGIDNEEFVRRCEDMDLRLYTIQGRFYNVARVVNANLIRASLYYQETGTQPSENGGNDEISTTYPSGSHGGGASGSFIYPSSNYSGRASSFFIYPAGGGSGGGSGGASSSTRYPSGSYSGGGSGAGENVTGAVESSSDSSSEDGIAEEKQASTSTQSRYVKYRRGEKGRATRKAYNKSEAGKAGRALEKLRYKVRRQMAKDMLIKLAQEQPDTYTPFICGQFKADFAIYSKHISEDLEPYFMPIFTEVKQRERDILKQLGTEAYKKCYEPRFPKGKQHRMTKI